MSAALDIRCAATDLAGLHEEIRRRDRIIEALIRQIEQGINTGSNYGLLQSTLALERLVQLRTEALHQSGREMEAFIAHAPVGIVFTRGQAIVRYNNQFATMFGFSDDEAVGSGIRTLFRSDGEYEAAREAARARHATPTVLRNEVCLRHRNGSDIWVRAIGYAISPEAVESEAVWIMEDRTGVRRAEEALRLSHQELLERTLELSRRELELRTVIDNAYDAYLSLDENGKVLSWNQRAEEIFGWTMFETQGRPLDELILTPDTKDGFLASLKSPAWEDKCLELPARRRDGSTLMTEIRISLLDFGEHRVFSAFLHDISARKEQEIQREHEARHDALTGLPNRRALMDLMDKAIARSRRNGHALGLLFLDLDGFKAVNDSYGHETGDILLVRIAQRLKKRVRQTDSIARLAGDEFVILMEEASTREEDATHYTARLIDDISRPFNIGDLSIQVGCSMGLLLFAPGNSQSPTELLQQADLAMYQAKRAGKGRCVISDLTPEQPDGSAP